MDSHYYYSETEYSPGCWIKNTQGKLPVSHQKYFTPGNSLELHYRSADRGNWEASILYHEIDGIDTFNEASHLSFWLYVTDSTEKESLPAVNLLFPDKKQSVTASLVDYVGSYKLNSWILVRVPLADFFKGTPMPVGQIKGIRFSNKATSKKEGYLFVDQVELLASQKAEGTLSISPQFLSAKGYERHIDLAWKKNSILL
jgi:hypothetical protein